MLVKSFGATDIGRVREENQDSFLIDEGLGLYIVADGMGGMESGDRASLYVTNSMHELVKAELDNILLPHGDFDRNSIKDIILRINTYLRKSISVNTGSTLVMLLLNGCNAIVVNVGDSPAYLLREGNFQKLTLDHNMAQILVEIGKLTPDQAMESPLRHQLISYMGMEWDLVIAMQELEMKPEDRILICTDGLTGLVREALIVEILKQEIELEAAVKKLINTANEEGGSDNTTVIVIGID